MEVQTSSFGNDILRVLGEARIWRKSRGADYGLHDVYVVYVFGDGNGWHKIGRSKDVSKRQKQIQYGNPRRIKLVAYLPCVWAQCDGRTWDHGYVESITVRHAMKRRSYRLNERIPDGPFCYCDSVASRAETAAHRAMRKVRGMGEWFYCRSACAFEALHIAARVAKVGMSPVDVCVGYDEQESTDGR